MATKSSMKLKSNSVVNKNLAKDWSSYVEAFERFKTRRQTVKLLARPYCLYTRLTASSTLKYFREDSGGVTSIRYFEGGDKVAVGFGSGDVKICTPITVDRWGNIDTKVVMKGWEGNYSISSLKCHPQKPDQLYMASTDGTICCQNLGELVHECEETIIKEEDNEINSIDFDMTGGMLVTGGKDAVIRVYDTVTHKMVHQYGRLVFGEGATSKTLDEDMHEKRVYCVKCHPEQPELFFSGGWDRIIKLWDTRVEKGCVRNVVGPYIFGESIDIYKKTLFTASCVASNSLELWDIGSGKLLSNIIPTNKKVYLYGEFPYTAQFFKGESAGDLILCGGSGLGGLQVISIKEASILYLFEDEKPVLAVDSNGTSIAYGGKSNSILFGNLYFPEEVPSEQTDSLSTTSDSSGLVEKQKTLT